MSTISVQRTVDGVLASADTTRLSIVNAAGTIIVNNVTVVAASVGVYSYDVSALAPTDYTVQWTFVVAGQQDDTVIRPLTVDRAISISPGYTVWQLEQYAAAQLGPYYKYAAAAGATTSAVTINRLKSTLSRGDYEEMYLLRRGKLNNGELVINWNDDDRQRLIETYTPLLGTLTSDRMWNTAPVLYEELELHALDPEQELREAVLEGLSECFFWDTLITATTTYLREINLTAVAPWITRPAQVRGVSYGRLSYLDEKAPWFEAYQSGANVWLKTAVPSVGNLRIAALRPHASMVNGELSGGPDSDNDVLHIERDYAVSAICRAAWKLFPERLIPLAMEKMRPTREEFAADFQLKSLRVAMEAPPEVIQNRFNQYDILESLQLGNG